MKKGFTTGLLMVVLSAIISVGVYKYVPLDWIDALPSFQEDKPFGATITTILGTDTLSGSRPTINTNFTNLNNGKVENSDYYGTTTHANISSLPVLTSAATLATIGTITTGRWNGIPLLSAYGGTGTTTFPAYHVLIASSTGAGIMSVSGLGTSGQFLTSQGAGTAPVWTTGSVDAALDRTWTGHNVFTSIRMSGFASSSDFTVGSTTAGTLVATSSITTRNLTVNNGCTGCAATTTYGSPGAATEHANVTFNENPAGMGVLSFTDAADAKAYWIVQVPRGATSISAIRVLYERQVSADLYITFSAAHLQGQNGSYPVAETTDSIAATTYATGGADNLVTVVNVPSTTYDGFSSITEGDIISLGVNRDAANAGDTYNQAWLVKGVLFEF